MKHMQEALNCGDQGDYAEMNSSINKSLINVEAFND
jgi:hypothetical protein